MPYHPEKLITRSIGKGGLFQIRIMLLLYLNRIWIAWNQLLTVLVTPNIGEFDCIRVKLSICHKYCPEHVFNHAIWKSTVIQEFELVCSRAWINNFIQFVVFLGIITGNLVFGYLADRIGRRICLLYSVITLIVGGVATSSLKNLYTYIVFRFITNIGTGGAMVTSLVLLMEYTERKYRALIGVCLMIPENIGQGSLAVIGYYSRYWNTIHLIVAVSAIVLLVDYYLPESVRWLLIKRQNNKCITILEQGARMNKLPTSDIKRNVEETLTLMRHIPTSGNIKDLFATKVIKRRTLVLCLIWMITSLEFYALLYFLDNVEDFFFINIAIGGLVQIPSVLVTAGLGELIGRKNTISFGFIMIAVARLIIIFVPDKEDWTTAVPRCLGLFGTAMNYSILYVYSCELIPTTIRAQGVGINLMGAQIGGIVAPYIIKLEIFKHMIPHVMFIIISIIGGFLLRTLLETKHKSLPDIFEV